MFFWIKTLILAQIALATTGNAACTDSTSFIFGTYTYNGSVVFQNCAWITQSLSLTATRQAAWCDINIGGSVVKDECPVACETSCTGPPTARPTVTPTSSPTRCIDSASYSFGEYFFDSSGWVTRTCAWITANPSRTVKRQGQWCDDVINGSIVKDECPAACDVCAKAPTKSPAPTNQPTRPPSPYPSPFPTARPSPSPSAKPSDFPTNQPTRPPSPMPSPFPTAMPSSSPSAGPTVKPSQRPSSSPSNTPSTKPTSMPSVAPSSEPTNRPTNSIKPSPSPSATPSIHISSPPSTTPTEIAFCVDSPLRLRLEKETGLRFNRYCSWVANKDTNNRCNLPGVAAACPATCATCSTCVDPDATLKFRFTMSGAELVRNCEYVARKSTNMRCAATGNICRATCKIC